VVVVVGLVNWQVGSTPAETDIAVGVPTVGLTVTVTVNTAPAQLPDVGVTVYDTAIGALVVLASVPLILEALLPAAVPVIPATVGANQL